MATDPGDLLNRPASFAFGDYISRGCQAWWDHITDWLGVVVIALLIGLASILTCIGPILAVGPLMVGIYAVALACLRGESNVSDRFRRGLDVLSTSIGAGVLMTLISMAPVLLMYGVMICAGGGMAIIGGARQAEANPPMQPAAILAAWQPGQHLAQVEREPGNFDFEPLEEPDFPANPNVMFQNNGRRQEPPTAAMLLGILCFYSMVFLCALISFLITTRLMFVYPLIAEYQIGVSEAFSLSWRATKKDFVMLLMLHFVAAIISSAGSIACGIGQILTAPILMTIVGSVFLDRFPREQPPELPVQENFPPHSAGSDNPFAAPG